VLRGKDGRFAVHGVHTFGSPGVRTVTVRIRPAHGTGAELTATGTATVVAFHRPGPRPTAR